MNEFLKKQLQNKVDKFFAGKSDLFVVGAQQWLSYGGCVEGAPKEMSPEDFEVLRKTLIGEDLLGRWLSDMRGENKVFSSMSLTDRDHMQNLFFMFADECYQRLRVRAYKDKVKACDRKIKYYEKKARKLYAQALEIDRKNSEPKNAAHE